MSMWTCDQEAGRFRYGGRWETQIFQFFSRVHRVGEGAPPHCQTASKPWDKG